MNASHHFLSYLFQLDDTSTDRWTISRKIQAIDNLREFIIFKREDIIKNSSYPRSDQHILDWLYRDIYEISHGKHGDKNIKEYSKANFHTFCKYFIRILDKVREHPETLDTDFITRQKIRSYLFDANNIYQIATETDLFPGKHNYLLTSQECKAQAFFIFSRLSLLETCSPFKGASWSSILILRKAMELKFRRILGFDDCRHKNTKKIIPLGNGIFRDIIKNNIEEFEYLDKSISFNIDDLIKNLIKIYEWTNRVVHSNEHPYMWQTEKAIRYSSLLFRGGVENRNSRLISHSDICFIINDYRRVQNELETKIKRENPEAEIRWMKPEAIIK